ncbi:conjugal transfer protein [Streptomyces sp. NBC_00424]|uniref:conjugal transfer protein n=1 Tax=Streptomyces sp. NBC_00424 TaxID=2903648 RepID=UPI002254C6B6|nr:conjugal transfer protein [Streptomyces sp. NBC_00424]MCX5078964.1 conjugal transfer protein [Streptomyces sp. NBC_00424]
MTSPTTPPPRPSRRIRRTVSTPLRTTRPETVPAAGPVSRGPNLIRIGVWTALAAGPLALAVAFLTPRTTTAQAAPAPSVQGTARPAADPAGAAAMFVDLWLRADAANPDNTIGTAVRTMAPEAELPKRTGEQKEKPAGARVVALRTTFAPGGAWTVVVAAVTDRPEPAPAGSTAVPAPAARYFAVSGTGGENGGPLAIEGSPAEVAAPETAKAPASRFTHTVAADGPLATTLGEFVRAYLAGGQSAGLDRYLSPGVRITPPGASAYTKVDVEDVSADAEQATDAAPADGARARVRVRVVGEDRAGARWPLVYRVEVTARAGRWEVSTLETGAGTPTASPAVSPSPAATTTVSGGAR